MIIYKEPNFSKAQEKAYQTVINSKITTLPINLKVIIKQFDNLFLKKYSVFARENGMTIPEVCELLNSEEGCLWRRGDNKYIIFYNDTVKSRERIRFTIAHEIGHFVLGHLEFAEKTKIGRYTLTDFENDAFEKEANYFAKRLLAPLPLVYDFVSIWNRITADLIMDIFDVSFTVSNHIINDLHRAQRNGIYRVFHDINHQFSDYINKVKYALWCNFCNHAFSIKNANYCPICGQKNFLFNDSIFVVRRNDDLIYPGFALDNDMRAVQCPRCGNEEVEGNYCKICATYLFNICTGIDDSDDEYYRRNIKWGQHNGGCGQILEGNARYCHECGSTSSFYEDGLLDNWNDNTNEKKQLVSSSGFPFSLSDDEISF